MAEVQYQRPSASDKRDALEVAERECSQETHLLEPDETDPETGERFTVKQYRSRKTEDQNGWRHMEITLVPRNHDFDPIVIVVDDEAEIKILAEMIGVLGTKLVRE